MICNFIYLKSEIDLFLFICNLCVTELEFDRDHHEKGFKFLNDTNDKIRKKAKSSHGSVLLLPLLNGNELKKITFQFIVHEFAWYSWFGFVSPEYKKTFNPKKGIYAVPDNYCVGSNIGKNIAIYTKKKRRDITFHCRINRGDKYIFDIDFELKECRVYVNEINEKQKICKWVNIPNIMLLMYTHVSSDASEITVQLMTYEITKN